MSTVNGDSKRSGAESRVNGAVVALLLGLTIVAGAVGVTWHLLGRTQSPVATAPESDGESARHALPGPPTSPPLNSQLRQESARASNVDAPDPATDGLTPEQVNLLPPDQSAKLRANKVLSELERSGPPNARLTSEALKVVENMKRLPALAGVEFGDFRCYGNGCAFTATSKDPGAAHKAGDALVRSEQFEGWSGPKFRSGQLPTPSGQVQTVVILYESPGNKTPATPRQEMP